VRVKFSHLTGYTSFAYARVVTRTVSQAEGSDKVYIVELECRNPKLMGGIGAGAPPSAGTVNNQIPPATQSGVSPTIILWGSNNDAAFSFTHAGAVQSFFDGTYAFVPRLIDGDDATPESPHDSLGGEPGFQVDLLSPQSVASVRALVWLDHSGNGTWKVRGADVEDFATYTVYEDAAVVSLGSSYTDVTLTLGSTAAHRYWRVGIEVGGFSGWRSLELRDASGVDLMRFLPASTPALGQPSGEKTPTPAPDGATTTFTTPANFVASTLRVEVDGIDQTDAVTSSTANTFTLSFAPLASESVRVWYSGAGTG
jgi:hypothetical protein